MAFDFTNKKDRQKFYGSKEWQAIREIVLQRDPLCVHCLKKDKHTHSYAVDHIIPLEDAPGRCLLLSNLQGLCGACHSRKSVLENNAWTAEGKGDIVNKQWNIDLSKFKR